MYPNLHPTTWFFSSASQSLCPFTKHTASPNMYFPQGSPLPRGFIKTHTHRLRSYLIHVCINNNYCQTFKPSKHLSFFYRSVNSLFPKSHYATRSNLYSFVVIYDIRSLFLGDNINIIHTLSKNFHNQWSGTINLITKYKFWQFFIALLIAGLIRVRAYYPRTAGSQLLVMGTALLVWGGSGYYNMEATYFLNHLSP